MVARSKRVSFGLKAWAMANALRTSAKVAFGTLPMQAPVNGLTTWMQRSPVRSVPTFSPASRMPWFSTVSLMPARD